MYICGPTVYNTPTIANLRTYISQDVLRRALKYLGYQVVETMNITDIEDKIIRDSNKQGIKYTELTEKYEKVFFDNLKQLNIEPVENVPHATDPDVIAKMIEIVEDLLQKGIAYKSEDGSVYFSIDKFNGYGKLSGLDRREVKLGARVSQDEYEKDNAQDFALWKAEKPGEPSWEAPFGKGRPGWHIECTAMSTMTLGKTIDIHGGGVDLIFPHHENEIAQSESYTGKEFVKQWFHTGHLLIDGQRMGKSLNNFYTVDDLINKFNVHPLSYRLLCLQSNYADSLNFTEESIKAADNTYKNILETVSRLKTIEIKGNDNKVIVLSKEFIEQFKCSIEDNLSTARALATLFDFMKKLSETSELSAAEVESAMEVISNFDSILGLNIINNSNNDIPNDIQDVFQKYLLAKSAKNYTESDQLRTDLSNAGFIVEDTVNGSRVIKKQ
jgi:cysteinyl-tRNA synthetase